MSFLKSLFGGQRLDGMVLVESLDLKEYAQIDLLAQFDPPQPLHENKEQARWSRVLPRPYGDEIALFQKQGWLEQRTGGAYRRDGGGPAVCAGMATAAGTGKDNRAGQGT